VEAVTKSCSASGSSCSLKDLGHNSLVQASLNGQLVRFSDAHPLTLLVRFAPRQRQKPMNELLSANSNQQEMDVVGSLMDADMGAYYNWLNQQRLPGAEKSSFLVWFEGHNSALAISPSIPRQTESESEADMTKILSWLV
jgi:hypothetical protein